MFEWVTLQNVHEQKVTRRFICSVAAKGRQGHRLSGDDIEYLRKNTRYDEKEIKEWYKGFKARTNILIELVECHCNEP